MFIGALLVERACINNRCGRAFAAQDHQQIAHHRRFTIFVKFHQSLVLQLGKCMLNHAHRTLDDLEAGRHYGCRLLPPQHFAGDLRRIGEM